MNDLLDMNFNQDSSQQQTTNKAPDENKQDLLADAFAQFGFNLDDEQQKEPREAQEDKDDEMSIPLPDFNTTDHKVKRILDMIPDDLELVYR